MESLNEWTNQNIPDLKKINLKQFIYFFKSMQDKKQNKKTSIKQ